MFENELKNFFEGRDEVVAAYVFGSYAAAKARRDRDVDIAVVSDSIDRTAVQRIPEKYMVKLSRPLRKDVHLVAMNFAGEAPLKQVFNKGKCI